MRNNDLNEKISRILRRNTRYAGDAYEFVSDAVTFTVSRLKKEKHVSALELLEGIRDYAFEQYGPFYRELLRNWGVTTARDVGKIVFALVEVQALAANEDDAPEDFEIDFDLFTHCYSLEQTIPKQLKVPVIDK